MEHSKLPWEPNSINQDAIFTDDCTVIDITCGSTTGHWLSTELDQANTQFIVTACNSYYDNKRKADAYPKLVDLLKIAACPNCSGVEYAENHAENMAIHKANCQWCIDVESLLTELGEL